MHICPSPGPGCGFYVEVDIVRDHQVELAVAVIVDEGAARAPLAPASGNPGLGRHFFECSVAFIVIQAILAVVGHIQVVESIVIVVTDAGALSPSTRRQPGGPGHIRECAIVIVMVEMAGGRRFLVRAVLGSRALPFTR